MECFSFMTVVPTVLPSTDLFRSYRIGNGKSTKLVMKSSQMRSPRKVSVPFDWGLW